MSDLSYLTILKQFEELYPQASGEVLAAAARCEMHMSQTRIGPLWTGARPSNVLDIRTHAATLRRART